MQVQRDSTPHAYSTEFSKTGSYDPFLDDKMDMASNAKLEDI